MAGNDAMSARPLAGPAASDVAPFRLAFAFGGRFGHCVGLGLGAAAADRLGLLRHIHPREALLCDTLQGARLVEWVGGRCAARRAMGRAGVAPGPILVGRCGAPDPGPGASISISHTRGLAVALASTQPGLTVGVDVETPDADMARPDLLAERILSADERRRGVGGETAERLLLRLTLKEAAFKAVFTLLGRAPPLRTITIAGTPGRLRASTPERNLVVELESLRQGRWLLGLAAARII
jgi:4'-phosphopantetheinyl transferase EntD